MPCAFSFHKAIAQIVHHCTSSIAEHTLVVVYKVCTCITDALNVYLVPREEEGEKEHKDPASQQKQLTEMPGSYSQFGTAALLLYGLNQGLSKLTTTLGIQFPSALIGSLPCTMSTA